MELSGWGRYPRYDSEVVRADSPAVVPGMVASHSGLIARGNGRAYGDAAIGETATLLARPLDRMRRFDPETGRLTVEAGVLLSEILDAFVPIETAASPPYGAVISHCGRQGQSGDSGPIRPVQSVWLRATPE